MKNLILTLLLAFTSGLFAQDKQLTYTIKKPQENIQLTLPTGTVINSGGKVTLGDWQVTIEATDKSLFDNDTVSAENKDLHILIGYSLKDMTTPNEEGKSTIDGMQFRKTKNEILISEWSLNSLDGNEPEKLYAARIAGNSILTLSMDNTINDAEFAKRQLVDILDRAIVVAEK